MMTISRCKHAVDMSSGQYSRYPRRTFIRWAMALPLRTTGSLWPTFVSARLVSLTVRQAYAIALYERFLTVLSLPSHASVTIWEASAPVKLPTTMSLRRITAIVRYQNKRVFHWWPTSTPLLQCLLLYQICFPNTNVKLQRCTGLSVNYANSHLHGEFNFTELMLRTAEKSLRHSCRSELTRQGISLP